MESCYSSCAHVLAPSSSGTMSWREDAQSTGSFGSWHRAPLEKPTAFRSTNGVTRIRPEPVHNAVDPAPLRFYSAGQEKRRLDGKVFSATNLRECNNETFWQAQQEHALTAYGVSAIHPLPFAGNVSLQLQIGTSAHPIESSLCTHASAHAACALSTCTSHPLSPAAIPFPLSAQPVEPPTSLFALPHSSALASSVPPPDRCLAP